MSHHVIANKVHGPGVSLAPHLALPGRALPYGRSGRVGPYCLEAEMSVHRSVINKRQAHLPLPRPLSKPL
jgi:hypothetical protein